MPPMTLNGIVSKAGFMKKTVTVTVSRFVNHKLTGKRIVRSKKYLVHDEENSTPGRFSSSGPGSLTVSPLELKTDDVVVIRNCPPKSAMKRFTLHQLLKSPETEREIARARRLQSREGTEPSDPAPTPSPVLEALQQQQQRQQQSPQL
ncbi:hypothetical protein D9611_005792 [Ephemerocybe angulata]|uniref:Nucleic acid-binding protein n=1 Tax=Ephemerocybe angulata TaxID=980116 RepID=A0A8H5F4J8_9AGAR|nr:hypothetical protein D9611_005792 [Tulosesus angulatus]